jgi:hypothetical protein
LFSGFVFNNIVLASTLECKSDLDCGNGKFCEFSNCNAENNVGCCVIKSESSICDAIEFNLIGSVCGCDGVTYKNDCQRRSEGVLKNYNGDCMEEISGNECEDDVDCEDDNICVNFPDIGYRCSKKDPCNYFNCSGNFSENICWEKTWSVMPNEVICDGNCASDSECETGEFCDLYSENNFEIGECVFMPDQCLLDDAPVCGYDGITYKNDCLRKKNGVVKNYNGTCIDEISNVVCDLDAAVKHACDLIGSCYDFPGIGSRCAPREVPDFWNCPEGSELRITLSLPQMVQCVKACNSSSDCNSTDYVDYGCYLSTNQPDYSCDGGISGFCIPVPEDCTDYPNNLVCGCNGIVYDNFCFLIKEGIIQKNIGECDLDGINITDITCSIAEPCPENTNFQCIDFPGLGLRCARSNPCSYYDCPQNTSCFLAQTYPSRVICGGSSDDVAGGSTDSTEKVIFGNNKVNYYINIDKTKERNVLQIPSISINVESDNELMIQGEKLFMKTTQGNKEIKISPEDINSNFSSVENIELKEDKGKPVYFLESRLDVRLFALIPVKMKIKSTIDAENNEILKVKKPWWSFLSKIK